MGEASLDRRNKSERERERKWLAFSSSKVEIRDNWQADHELKANYI